MNLRKVLTYFDEENVSFTIKKGTSDDIWILLASDFGICCYGLLNLSSIVYYKFEDQVF